MNERSEEETGSATAFARWRAAALSAVLAALGYAALAAYVGVDDVVAAGRQIGWGGAAVLLGLSLVNYSLRFLRWQLYLRRLGSPQPWRPSLAIYLSGFALTTTPGRAGEVIRSWFLHGRGVPYTISMAAFFSERLSDVVGVTLLAVLGLGLSSPWMPLVAALLALLVLLHVMLANERWIQAILDLIPQRANRLSAIAREIIRLFRATQRCHSPGLLIGVSLLSVVAWSAEAFALHLLLKWVGGSTGVAYAVFVYAVGMLVGGLSFLPGGLGGTEATMVGLLAWGGYAHAAAVSATVIIRAATLWFAVALGMMALAGLVLARRRAAPRATLVAR